MHTVKVANLWTLDCSGAQLNPLKSNETGSKKEASSPNVQIIYFSNMDKNFDKSILHGRYVMSIPVFVGIIVFSKKEKAI